MTTNKIWQSICQKDDLVKHSGVCALLNNDTQIALFQTSEDEVFGIDNWDPVGKANVLYRGIIGDIDGEVFVASPLYKERFSLKTGQCLDDENLTITPYPARIIEGNVQVLA